jgi:hypothetical protein
VCTSSRTHNLRAVVAGDALRGGKQRLGGAADDARLKVNSQRAARGPVVRGSRGNTKLLLNSAQPGEDLLEDRFAHLKTLCHNPTR